MHNTPTTTPGPRARAVRRLAVTGAGALVLAALPTGVAGAHGGWDEDGDRGGHVWYVEPGQSIQAAVEQAGSGDTIKLAPGTYTEAVCIDGKGLTIEGSGRDTTKIVWPEWSSFEDLPAVTDARSCWTEQERVDLEDVDGDLRDNVSALFFLNPDAPVSVSALRTENHPASGVLLWGAHGAHVSDTEGYYHDRYGILAVASADVRVYGNAEFGLDRGGPAGPPNSGTAGISLGDSADAGAKIAGNHVEGYNLGVFLREASGARVEGNTLTGNCVGLLAFDDTATEVPDQNGNVDAGHFTIAGNELAANNRFCLQGREGDQRISGVGMGLVNVEDVSVEGNSIRDHRPSTPPPPGVVVPPGAPTFTFPSAGLSLVTFVPFVPGPGVPGEITDVRVVGNDFGSNQALVPTGPAPAPELRLEMDIFESFPTPDPNNPLRPVGPGLVYEGNSCDASIPPTICGEPYPVQ